MNKMLGYLKDYKRESVLAPLFKMLEATFDLFVPLVMADIVNIGIAAHDFHYILVRCGILLLLVRSNNYWSDDSWNFPFCGSRIFFLLIHSGHVWSKLLKTCKIWFPLYRNGSDNPCGWYAGCFHRFYRSNQVPVRIY